MFDKIMSWFNSSILNKILSFTGLIGAAIIAKKIFNAVREAKFKQQVGDSDAKIGTEVMDLTDGLRASEDALRAKDEEHLKWLQEQVKPPTLAGPAQVNASEPFVVTLTSQDYIPEDVRLFADGKYPLGKMVPDADRKVFTATITLGSKGKREVQATGENMMLRMPIEVV